MITVQFVLRRPPPVFPRLVDPDEVLRRLDELVPLREGTIDEEGRLYDAQGVHRAPGEVNHCGALLTSRNMPVPSALVRAKARGYDVRIVADDDLTGPCVEIPAHAPAQTN